MKGYKRARPDRGSDAWELVADLGRDPVSGQRRRISRLFRGRERAADSALAQLVADVTRDRIGPGTDAPLSVLLDRWLEMVADDLSPTTLRGYRQVIRSQIAPALGARPVSKLTTPELDGFYRALLVTRSPATVRQTHAIIRRALRQGVRWGWIDHNPAADATPPTVRRPTLHIPTTEQVSALIAAADEDFAPLLRTAATTGARRGELCGLRWSRVDLDAASMLISTAVVEAAGGLVEKGTKTHQSRLVALDMGTVTALRKLRDRHRRECLAFGATRAADPYVFAADPTGTTPIRPDRITAVYRQLAKDHAPGTRLHDLRHFAASRLLAARVPVKDVSARLGHASAAMTLDVYGHVLQSSDVAAAAIIGEMLA